MSLCKCNSNETQKNELPPTTKISLHLFWTWSQELSEKQPTVGCPGEHTSFKSNYRHNHCISQEPEWRKTMKEVWVLDVGEKLCKIIPWKILLPSYFFQEIFNAQRISNVVLFLKSSEKLKWIVKKILKNYTPEELMFCSKWTPCFICKCIVSVQFRHPVLKIQQIWNPLLPNPG